MNHTKGNWFVIIDEAENEHPILSDNCKNIACVNAKSHYGNCDKEEAEANAKLLCAAPVLLEALTEIIPFAKQWINENHPAMQKALEAIKKATE